MRHDTGRLVAPSPHRPTGRAPVRLVWNRKAPWARLRRQLRWLASHPRFGETVLVGLTAMVVGLLLATLHHALQGGPPGSYAVGFVPS